MFTSCNNLTNLGVSKFDTSNVTNMSYMFRNCSKLINLDISNFVFDKVTSKGYIFRSMPTSATIKVKDANVQSWILNLTGDDRPSSWNTSNVVIA